MLNRPNNNNASKNINENNPSYSYATAGTFDLFPELNFMLTPAELTPFLNDNEVKANPPKNSPTKSQPLAAQSATLFAQQPVKPATRQRAKDENSPLKTQDLTSAVREQTQAPKLFHYSLRPRKNKNVTPETEMVGLRK